MKKLNLKTPSGRAYVVEVRDGSLFVVAEDAWGVAVINEFGFHDGMFLIHATCPNTQQIHVGVEPAQIAELLHYVLSNAPLPTDMWLTLQFSRWDVNYIGTFPAGTNAPA